MGVTVGSGEFRYEVIEGWGKLPDGWTFKEVAAVAVDKKDQVYCFTRGAHPIIVFDRNGSFLRSWGEGVFKRAHGATIGPDETIFLSDDGDHTVRNCTLDGTVICTLGVRATRLIKRRPSAPPVAPREIYVSTARAPARAQIFPAEEALS
jgi:hypothetical protein